MANRMYRAWREMPLFIIVIAFLTGLAVWQLVMPQMSFSDLENRYLTQMSEPTPQSILSGQWMKNTEKVIVDQFPMRNSWVALNALEATALLKTQQNGVVIGRDGWLFEPCTGLKLRTASMNVKALNTLAQKSELPITMMLVPMSSAIYGDMLPFGYKADDQTDIISSLYNEMKNITTMPLIEAMLAESSEQPLFFRTDHHWSAAGMNVGYKLLAREWGFEPSEADTETVPFSGNQLGSYYAKFPSPLIRPDVFDFAFPSGVDLEVDGVTMNGLYDAVTIASKRDKYAELLYGNHGSITLHGAAKDGVLLVIKDSYANALLPLLAQHYKRIEAVDLRYFKGDLHSWLLSYRDATQILCIYGLTTWLSDRNLPRQAAKL